MYPRYMYLYVFGVWDIRYIGEEQARWETPDS